MTVASGAAHSSTAAGADGFPLVAVYDTNNNDLKIVHCNDATCSSSTTTVLDSVGTVGRYPSVTVGSDGFGLVSYLDATSNNLKTAHCTNLACTAFTTATIVSSGAVADDSTSVNVGTDGFGVVSYVDGGNLKVAHCTNVACSSAGANTIDATGGRLLLDRDRRRRAPARELPRQRQRRSPGGALRRHPLRELDDHRLRHVRQRRLLHVADDRLGRARPRQLPRCNVQPPSRWRTATTSPARPPTLSTVDSNGIEGEYSAITLGTDGLGVISYYDGSGSGQDLKVAHCGNVACSTSSLVAVDTAGQVGWNTSITVGSDGLPFVSYRDVTGDSVKGLHCPNVFCVAHLRRR